jgi:hypothetical protein
LRRTPREVIRAAIISASSRAVFFSFVIVGLVEIGLSRYSVYSLCDSLPRPRLSACARHGVGLNTLPPGRGLSKKVTIVQEEDIKLLRRIVAGGGRKYTAGNIDRSRYDRLVDLGWLTPFKTNISDVEYQVTEKGRAAAVANGHD